MRVDDINLVTNRVYGEPGGIEANLQGAILTKIDKIENRDGVGDAVADIGIFAIAIGDVGKAAAVAAGAGKEKRKRGCGGDNSREKEEVTGGWHYSESIGDARWSARLLSRFDI